jgi:hypothetical protein
MTENSDAQPQAPEEYTPLGADLAAPADDHPEFFKPKPEDEAVVTPGAPLTLTDPAMAEPRTNRKGAVWIALTGGVVFALLYLLATILYSWAAFTWGDNVGGRDVFTYVQNRSFTFASTPIYWLTSIAFFFYFTLLALFFYGATWRAFVIGGLGVALLTYATAIGAGLLTISAWTLTLSEALAFTWRSIAFNPLILVTLILAREIPIWFGGWIAVRAKKLRDKDLSS